MQQFQTESSPANTSALMLLAGLGSSIILLVVFLGMRSQLTTAVLGLYALGCLWLSLKMPVSTVGLYWLLMIVPNLFMLSPVHEEMDPYFYSMKPSDVLLVIMSAATLVRLVRFSSRPKTSTIVLGLLAALFLALVAYGVTRNLERYGIRAPGEFRHRYLVIGASLYVATVFDSPEARLRLLRTLSSLTVFVIFAAMPVVAIVSSWTPGSGERLFPADVSLTFLFGLAAILLLKWNGLRFMENSIAYLSVPFGILQIVLDNHRSVWLAAIVVIAFLLITKQVSMLRLTAALGVLVLVSLAGKALVSANQGRSFGEFMTERAMAFTNPEADGTASWRIQQWEIQMPKFRENPVFGIGLGGYWGTDDNLVAGNLGVMPHNYYVGTLVKLGATGLAAYAATVITLTVLLIAALRSGFLAVSDRVIAMLAMLVIFGAHAYYSAYWIDATSWIWIGLGAAVCIHMRRTLWLVSYD